MVKKGVLKKLVHSNSQMASRTIVSCPEAISIDQTEDILTIGLLGDISDLAKRVAVTGFS